jgi:hypothetical protein
MSHADIQDIDTSDLYSFGCYPMQGGTAIRAGTSTWSPMRASSRP